MRVLIAFWLLLAPLQATAWELNCEQSRESLNDLYADPWFAKPEHRLIREKLAQKLKQHTSPYCGYIYQT